MAFLRDFFFLSLVRSASYLGCQINKISILVPIRMVAPPRVAVEMREVTACRDASREECTLAEWVGRGNDAAVQTEPITAGCNDGTYKSVDFVIRAGGAARSSINPVPPERHHGAPLPHFPLRYSHLRRMHHPSAASRSITSVQPNTSPKYFLEQR
jgi:hypothetical protein